MDCKRALQQAEGDISKAEELLRAQGIASVAKRAAREARQGVIESYIHSGSRIGALVELNCETDFVGRTKEFRELAHNLAMQIAAMAPLYVDQSQIPPGENCKPEETCLLQQPFIKDPNRIIKDIIDDLAARVGEKISVRRFSRFALGE